MLSSVAAHALPALRLPLVARRGLGRSVRALRVSGGALPVTKPAVKRCRCLSACFSWWTHPACLDLDRVLGFRVDAGSTLSTVCWSPSCPHTLTDSQLQNSACKRLMLTHSQPTQPQCVRSPSSMAGDLNKHLMVSLPNRAGGIVRRMAMMMTQTRCQNSGRHLTSSLQPSRRAARPRGPDCWGCWALCFCICCCCAPITAVVALAFVHLVE